MAATSKLSHPGRSPDETSGAVSFGVLRERYPPARLIYLASPLIALHSIQSAVQTKDAAALTERIDFPALKRSLTRQIIEEYLKLTGKKLPLHAMGKRLAVSLADPVVARLMTIRALLDLLEKGDAGEKAKVPIERAPFTSRAFGGSG
jgi:Protein of unknown function (DUF2939)